MKNTTPNKKITRSQALKLVAEANEARQKIASDYRFRALVAEHVVCEDGVFIRCSAEDATHLFLSCLWWTEGKAKELNGSIILSDVLSRASVCAESGAWKAEGDYNSVIFAIKNPAAKKIGIRERIAAACEKAKKKDLAASVRDKNTPLEVLRKDFLVGIRCTSIRFVSTDRKTIRTLQLALEEYKHDTDLDMLRKSKSRIFGHVYAYANVGSGKWTRPGATASCEATGFCKLEPVKNGLGTWIVIYNGRGKNAQVIKRLRADGQTFAYFSPVK